ncbi:hypothetical protein FB451DRAFT_1427209 [Mycena latifolia]|nr:hypothetical protein FB451DRAFT_1427209 [Mycena latifolia]
MEPTLLSAEYLASQPELTLARLRKIIRLSRRLATLPVSSAKNPAAAIRLIVSDKITVDWSWALGVEQDEARTLDLYMRELLVDKKIEAPVQPIKASAEELSSSEESDLSSTPASLKNWVLADEKPAVPAVTKEETSMDVDSPICSEDEGDDKSSESRDFEGDTDKIDSMDIDSGDDSGEDSRDDVKDSHGAEGSPEDQDSDTGSEGGEQPLQEDNGKVWRGVNTDPDELSDFWSMLERAPDDNPLRVKLIIADSVLEESSEPYLLQGVVFLPLQHGPPGSECFYLDPVEVLQKLETLGKLPSAPWRCTWLLAGFPWQMGIMAYRATDDTSIQVSTSAPLRGIPVTGPRDYLRAMIRFQKLKEVKASTCTTNALLPLANFLKQVTVKPDVDPDVKPKMDDDEGDSDDVKGSMELDVKPDPDVKLTRTNKRRPKTAQGIAKKEAMEAFLQEKFKEDTLTQEIRNDPHPKAKHPAKQVSAWVAHVSKLCKDHPVCLDSRAGSAWKKKISEQDWAELFHRGADWQGAGRRDTAGV